MTRLLPGFPAEQATLRRTGCLKGSVTIGLVLSRLEAVTMTRSNTERGEVRWPAASSPSLLRALVLLGVSVPLRRDNVR